MILDAVVLIVSFSISLRTMTASVSLEGTISHELLYHTIVLTEIKT